MPFTKRGFIKFSEIIILVVIFTAGLFVYFYKLGSIPSGLYIDEASPGYNAYSLLQTGKDEYGKSLPILFRFQGLYAPPLYTYLATIPVSLFGLSTFSVRFIAVLAGLASMFVIYFLLKYSGFIKERTTHFLGTVFFVFSPWLILHSRFGYEVSTAFFITSVGVYFLWLGLKRPKLVILGLVILSMSTYAGHTQRFLAPLLSVGYLVTFRSKFYKRNSARYIIFGLIIALIIQIPYLSIVNTPAFLIKSTLINKNEILSQAEKVANFMPFSISVILSYLREFFSQYIAYFSPRSLFFLPDPDIQRSAPVLSVFYFWMIVPYVIGLYVLWKERERDFARFIFLLAILAPVPASFASDPFSSYRAFPLILPLFVIISIGIDRLISKKPAKLWVPAFSLLIAVSFLLLWRSYFVFLPKERARVWGYGFKHLASQIKNRPGGKFVIDQSRMKPPYIELAFYLEYPPEKFHQEVDQTIRDNYYYSTDLSPSHNFANIETRNIKWEVDIYRKQILVGDELAISEGQASEHFLTKVFEIRSPVDEIIFVGYETDPSKKCLQNPLNLDCKNL